VQAVLLERAGELAVIDAALEDACEGTGRLVIVEGPAGIGKSSIVAEGRSRAVSVGMEVLQARGNELEASFSWGVVRQLFEPLVVQLDDAARDDLFRDAASRALGLFRATESDEPVGTGEDDLFALLHGLYWLTVNRASGRPLLIAVDDLQWGDVASLRWLSYLSRRLEGLEVCILAAVRPLEDEDRLVAELLTDPVNPLLRNSVYQGIAPHERPWAHARAATTLSSLAATTEAVAAQLLLAPPGAFEGASATLRKAARAAAAEGAMENAAKYLRRALDEPVEGDERGEVLLALGEAESATLGPASGQTSFSEALAHLHEADLRRRAWLRLGRALAWSGRYEEAVEAFASGLRERPGVADDVAMRLEAELLWNAIRLPDRQRDAYARISRVDVRASSGIGAALLIGLQAYGDAVRGTHRERAIERAHEALSVHPLPHETEAAATSFSYALYALLSADLLTEGSQLLDAAVADSRRRGAVFSWSASLMGRAWVALLRGAVVDAETDARLALDTPANELANAMAHFLGWFVQILVERGCVEEAASLLTEDRVGVIRDDSWQLLRARGIVAAARRDYRTALGDALMVGDVLDSLGVVNPAASYPGWRSEAALAHHALGEPDEAIELASQEVALARAWGAPRALGRALRVLGVVDAGPAGIEHLREAVAILEESPARLEHAYAIADLGAALRRANQRRAARELLRRALELAQQSGARRLAERTHAELIASGARPRRLEQSGVESLTPSERRVAAMAGDGLSNREIAQELFVTLRTVEMHLTHAFRKLDVSSRTQLAGAFDEASSAAA
jgi:DNA-binding CsgD family transcriptional regulator